MFLVYRPEGGEEQRWTYLPQKLRVSEAEALEKRTGWDFEEFGSHLVKGSVVARRALLWLYQRRVHPTLRFEDVDFAIGEVSIEFDRDELLGIRSTIEKQPASAEREAALTVIDDQLQTAPEPEGKAPAS